MPDQFLAAHFPKAGIDRATAYGKQPARQLPSGRYARTCGVAVNVRAFEPATGRCRGGSRPGISKWIANPVVADWLVQRLGFITGTGYDPPGGGVGQTSLSGRLVTVVAVSQGNVYVADVGDTDWTSPTNNTGNSPPLNLTGLVRSANNNQRMYFVDGFNKCFYSPATNSVEDWAITAGEFPTDSSDNLPRLICTYRGRTVLAGLIEDPQNIFASRVSDPSDWDYSPASPSPTQAWALNISELGGIGDAVNCLIPFSDDELIVGTDSQLHVIRGDPAAGGDIYTVSKAVGMAFGEPYAIAPDGVVYFFSQRPGVWRMEPRSKPVRISAPIDELLRTIDTGANAIFMLWDDADKNLELFISPLAAPASATHYTWESRTGGWVQRVYANNNHNPLCGCVIDGNDPTDRVIAHGSWDGYIRILDRDAENDDGTAISSRVVIGPLVTPNLDEVTVDDMQVVLGETSGDVTWKILVGRTAEAALSASAFRTGTLSAGRNLTKAIQAAAHAIYVDLSTTNRFSMESIRLRVRDRGRLRMRGR